MDSGSSPRQEGAAPGELRAEREKRGWTLAEAAGRLRISPAQLQALEEDRYADLPGPTFVRGYLRNYARLLALDPEAVLQAYARMSGEGGRQPTQHVLPPTEGPLLDYSRRTLFVSAVSVLLLIGLAWWLWGSSRESSRHEGNAPHSSAASAPAVSAPEPAARPAPGVPEPAGAVQVHPPAVSGPSVTAATASAQPSPGLEFRFSGTCWVQVRDATGRILLSGLGKAGEKMRAGLGTPPYRVLVGKASAVRVYYEGQPVQLPGNPFGVVRLEIGTPVHGPVSGTAPKNGGAQAGLPVPGSPVLTPGLDSSVARTLSSPTSGNRPVAPVPAGAAVKSGLASSPTASEVS